MEILLGHTQEASTLIDRINNSKAPTNLDPELENDLYGRLSIAETLIAVQKKLEDVSVKLKRAGFYAEKVEAYSQLVADYLYACAKVCQMRGRKTEAAAFARESLRIWQKSNGVSLPNSYLDDLNKTAKLDDISVDSVASKESAEKINIFPRIRIHLPEFEIALGTGAKLEDEGNLVGAESCYQEALRLADAAGASDTSELALAWLAKLNNQKEDFNRAETYARRAVMLQAKRPSDAAQDASGATAALCWSLWGQGKFAELRPLVANLKQMVTDGKLPRGAAVEARLLAGMTERVFDENQTAYNDLSDALRLSETDIESVWTPRFVILWQSAALFEQTDSPSAAIAMIREAKRLSNLEKKPISQQQRARLYASVAAKDPFKSKDAVADWTEAVRLSKIAYGNDDCHTKDYLNQLHAAELNYRNRNRTVGSMAMPPSYRNLEEPLAVVRP